MRRGTSKSGGIGDTRHSEKRANDDIVEEAKNQVATHEQWHILAGKSRSSHQSDDDDDVDSETRLDTGDKKIGADRRVEGKEGKLAVVVGRWFDENDSISESNEGRKKQQNRS